MAKARAEMFDEHRMCIICGEGTTADHSSCLIAWEIRELTKAIREHKEK